MAVLVSCRLAFIVVELVPSVHSCVSSMTGVRFACPRLIGFCGNCLKVRSGGGKEPVVRVSLRSSCGELVLCVSLVAVVFMLSALASGCRLRKMLVLIMVLGAGVLISLCRTVC